MSELVIEYEQDFYGWLLHNAKLIRDGRFSEIDAQNVAEELETMGRSEKRALESRLIVLLAHLLKWQYQPAKRSRSWKNTIKTQREDLADLLQESPSLRYELKQKLEKAYKKAKRMAEDETGIQERYFPKKCPFSLDETLEADFYPSEKE